jgi:hypothetical protein
MSVKSSLFKDEKVVNADRRFGSNTEYYPCYITRGDGAVVPALFTQHQIAEAVERAAKNPEDVDDRATWLDKIFS